MYGFSDHLNAMPAHAVERRPARLLAILDPHMATIEHMFDGLARLDRCRCRCGRATSTATCSRAGTAGRSSTRASSCPSRTRCSPRSPASSRSSRIVITHFHPDHVGGAQQAQAATGAPVHQGALDYEQCAHVWGNDDWPERDRRLVPRATACRRRWRTSCSRRATCLRAVHPLRLRDPELARRGRRASTAGGVLAMPGHADGHLALLRDGVLVAGDHLLPRITPAVGLYPESRPRPARRLPRLARAHRRARRRGSRCRATASRSHDPPHALRGDRRAPPRAARRDRGARSGRSRASGYEVSLRRSSARELDRRSQRRFAVAETLSHLERLVARGRGPAGTRTTGASPILRR